MRDAEEVAHEADKPMRAWKREMAEATAILSDDTERLWKVMDPAKVPQDIQDAIATKDALRADPRKPS